SVRPPGRTCRGPCLEVPALESTAPLFEQRPGAGEIAVGQVLVADRNLDQAMERFSLAAPRIAPEGLEQLVHLEVEVRVEERRGGVQGVGARVETRGRQLGERGGGAQRPLPYERPAVEIGREPVGRWRVGLA